MSAVMESERSMASVVQDVVGNLDRIVRAEVRLAKVEIAEQVVSAGRAGSRAATRLAVGAAVGQLALGLVLLAAVRALETVVAPWLAALLIAAGAAAIAMALLASGLRRLKLVNLLSPSTRESSTGKTG